MQDISRKRILCVDDDLDTCELLGLTLSTSVVRFAQSLNKGLEAMKEPFDLYILDKWLPDGSGIDLCRHIRGFDSKVPILFLSAAAYDSDHEEASAAGASDYIDKPAGLYRLEATVAKLMRDAESRIAAAKIAVIGQRQVDTERQGMI